MSVSRSEPARRILARRILANHLPQLSPLPYPLPSSSDLANPDQLGTIVIGLTFAVLAAAASILLRDVSTLLLVDMRLSRSDGTAIFLRPPEAKGGYHLFCSHCWRFGQDQAATIKALITLMLPDCRVFLDVDNLKSIASLEAHIAESDVVCIFLTRRLSPCPYPTW